MKQRFKGLLVSLVLMCGLIPVAQAWTVTAFDKESGSTYTVWNAATPEEAKNKAIIGCQKIAKVTDCEPWKAVNGTAVVIASGQSKNGGGNYASQVTNQNPETAASVALAGCRKAALNCKLTLAVWDSGAAWVAVAKGAKSGLFVSYDASTRAEAEQGAIDGCEKSTSEKGTCAVVPDFVTANHAWFVLAGNDNNTGVGGSSESKSSAEARALHACREGNSTPDTCKVSETVENRGPIQAPASFQKIQQQVELNKSPTAPKAPPSLKKFQEANSCRPKTQTLTCSSQCTNGDCTVTYENGCKVRVQVQPRFDSITNSWTYPSPAC